MNTKHTPGPWHVTGWESLIVSDSFNRTIALYPGAEIPEAQANARLIAAAPELLACLIDAVRCLEFAAPIIEAPEKSAYRETIAQARAAIAKATGETK